MGTETGNTDRLITRREFADLVAVERPTVSTWSRRHADFPEPIRSGGSEYFSLNALLAWLQGRRVPANALLPGEPEGTTFADRVSRRLAESAFEERLSDVPEAPSGGRPAPGQSEPGRLPTELFGSLADHVRGSGSPADYLYLLLALLLVRRHAPLEWDRIISSTTSDGSVAGDPLRLVGRVGHIADQVLRRHGVPPGIRASIERLRPRHSESLAGVLRLCDELDDEAFGPLLSRLEETTRPDSREFHTPAEVTRLMAGMLALDEMESPQAYDPYLRGGELLAAVAEARAANGTSPELRGEHPSIDGLRLAGMRLAYQGLSARLTAGTATPWADGAASRPKADVVLTNPPFNAGGSAAQVRNAVDWPFGPPPPGNDNYAWLQYAFASLNDTGRSAVVMPTNASTSTKRHEQAIRTRMVDQGVVECVLALPARLFPLTPVAVHVWFLARTHTGRRTDPSAVLFIDATGMGTLHRGRRSLSERERGAIVDCHADWRSGEEQGPWELDGRPIAISIPVKEIKQQDYALVPSYYVADARQRRSTPGAGGSGRLAELWDGLSAACERTERLLNSTLEHSPQHAGAGEHDGWTEVPLADLCEIQAGPSSSRLKDPGEPGEGVPIIEPKHLADHRIFVTDARTLPYEAAARMTKFHVREGDILSVRTASIGRSALAGPEHDGFVLGPNLLRLRPRDTAEVSPDYLLGYLSRPSAVEWIRSRSSGSAVPLITAKALGRLPVRLPPRSEQRLIGSALHALDQQITAHQEYVRALEARRGALIDELMPRA